MQVACAGIDLGPFTLTCFSLIVAVAAVAGSLLTAWVARCRGENPLIVFNLFCWMLLLGVVFARLFYVLSPPPSVAALYSREWYLAHPFDLQIGLLAVWSGGLSMAGMLVGAVLGTLLVIRRQRLDGWLWADISVPGLLLILIVAPWGNLLMGQMLGPPTGLPWGVSAIYSPPPYDNPAAYPSGLLFHPTPAYLSLWALIALCVIWGTTKIAADRFHKGDVFLYASLVYGVGLFLGDFLRVDVSRGFAGFSGLRTVALGVLLWSVGMLVWRYHKRRQ
ncbi:MAG: prolipoprotein diacylglyceryl transferase [Anaerolineae bacterium]|nr:prolipoprotein diacylglyceryl transferase [Anaerolineae bacterium]